MAVVAAVKFNDLVAPSESARQANARHRRLGPAVDHPDLLNRWHPLADQFRQFHFERVRNSKTQSARGRIPHVVDHNFRGVTENSRTPTPDVIDEFPSIDVPDS